ncbi:putative FAD-binding domain, FAD/NAD(P)-binding domain superfamily [Septoria linicola]|nr:putative FAD-binding domain, FAD/NAD(P)-binding domain superfamily [Septoria linicola]
MAQPILIIGAGISGLTAAQALRKEGIPCRIFERDQSPFARAAGWGLTLNWALPAFRSLLPEDILLRLPETYVNADAVRADQKGNFTFYDLSTGEAKWKVPAGERIRVSRERLRNLLLTGLNVEWDKNVGGVTKKSSGVTISFFDGTSATGSFLIACDGAHSLVRRLVYPNKHENFQLPMRFLGAGVDYPESQVRALRRLDPYFMQGADPRTDAYLWFSFLETPGDPGCPENDAHGESMYHCQVMVSWPYRAGFFGLADPSGIPNTTASQLSWMQAVSSMWAEPFRSVVQNIPTGSQVKAVELSDWVPQRNTDEVFDGRVVLLGDAMHAMVVYRGEGANHAIMDVSVLLDVLKPLFTGRVDLQVGKVDKAFRDAVDRYENEVVARTETAVLASRQACLDAHNFERINDDSPLIRKRIMRAD